MAALVLPCTAVSARPDIPTLDAIFAARKQALAALHVHSVKTLEMRGTVSGLNLQGAFHSWQTADNERYDEAIGDRFESSLRIADRQYIINQSGNVREVRGILAQRQRTADFINSERFASETKYDRLNGVVTLPDGRQAYEIVVAPPQGQPEKVYIDTQTSMIDRISYDANDGTSTEDYYEYKTFAGALVAQREVDSNGDRSYDVTHTTTRVSVNKRIDPAIFTLPPSTVVETDKPVTVPLEEQDGHYYVRVGINGHPYKFLLDTGAQGIVLDAHVAAEQHLVPKGRLQVSGAQRIGGLGFAALDSMQIGTANLPVHLVSVLDLRGVTGRFSADGILGYPFFAAAEVSIDAHRSTMTFARPGTLKAGGTTIPIDVDRELIEMQGKVNNVEGRFVVDTGNSTELLLFAPFMQAHPNLIDAGDRHFAFNYGVGGSASAVAAIIDEIEMGGFRFFNRYASIMLTNQGAFADRFDAGNIGMAVLKNFVVTFDAANAKMYLERGAAFDDGRYRPRTERMGIGIPR
jgi:predicted aspartyl protease